MTRTIATVNYNGAYPVSWTESGGVHTVTYGAQVCTFSRYINAHGNFMACNRHAQACAGLYDTLAEPFVGDPHSTVVNSGAFNN